MINFSQKKELPPNSFTHEERSGDTILLLIFVDMKRVLWISPKKEINQLVLSVKTGFVMYLILLKNLQKPPKN